MTRAPMIPARDDAAKLPFIECEKPYPKGLYARARRGEQKGHALLDARSPRP
jgi:hypothetical protein